MAENVLLVAPAAPLMAQPQVPIPLTAAPPATDNSQPDVVMTDVEPEKPSTTATTTSTSSTSKEEKAPPASAESVTKEKKTVVVTSTEEKVTSPKKPPKVEEEEKKKKVDEEPPKKVDPPPPKAQVEKKKETKSDEKPAAATTTTTTETKTATTTAKDAVKKAEEAAAATAAKLPEFSKFSALQEVIDALGLQPLQAKDVMTMGFRDMLSRLGNTGTTSEQYAEVSEKNIALLQDHGKYVEIEKLGELAHISPAAIQTLRTSEIRMETLVLAARRGQDELRIALRSVEGLSPGAVCDIMNFFFLPIVDEGEGKGDKK